MRTFKVQLNQGKGDEHVTVVAGHFRIVEGALIFEKMVRETGVTIGSPFEVICFAAGIWRTFKEVEATPPVPLGSTPLGPTP